MLSLMEDNESREKSSGNSKDKEGWDTLILEDSEDNSEDDGGADDSADRDDEYVIQGY
jgi:hypothetical protein